MRHVFSMTIAACMLATTNISGAADLPVRAPVAPSPPPAWTGCHVGLNAGGVWARMRDNWSAFPPPPAIPNVLLGVASGTVDASGFIGGGQLGCNWQINATVLGVEADMQYTHLDASRRVSWPGDANSIAVNFREDFRSRWLATFRGRAGWLMNPDVLLYATGGLALARLQTFDSIVAAADPNDFVRTSGSSTRVGWTVGGGAEWMFAPRWSVKAEYLYVNLGTFNTTGIDPDFPTRPFLKHSHQLTEHIARVGVNYKFY
jgi:outer membrane immunogenic protein